MFFFSCVLYVSFIIHNETKETKPRSTTIVRKPGPEKAANCTLLPETFNFKKPGEKKENVTKTILKIQFVGSINLFSVELNEFHFGLTDPFIDVRVITELRVSIFEKKNRLFLFEF